MPAWLVVFLFSWLWPAYSWALQTHKAPEGFIAHQLAHIFFFGAMLLFSYRLKRVGLTQRPHWNLIRWGALLLGIWNLWAFAGHMVEHLLPESVFLGGPGGAETHYCRKHLLIAGWPELAYFILKNDNLIAVPAFYLIYKGLKRLNRLLQEGL